MAIEKQGNNGHENARGDRLHGNLSESGGRISEEIGSLVFVLTGLVPTTPPLRTIEQSTVELIFRGLTNAEVLSDL